MDINHNKLKLMSRDEIEELLLHHMDQAEKLNAKLREANLQLAAGNFELQKTLGLQEEFTSIVSHEMRTPLTAIVGAAGMLAQHSGVLTAQKTRQFLEMIMSESWRLSRLVGEILDLSRIQKKGIPLSYETLNLSALVAEIVDEMRRAHPVKRFDTFYCSTAEVIEGDRDRLRQILVNLMGNAVKYAPDGTAIRIETKSDGPHIHLAVADTGPGIPADQHERIFEPFYRTKDAINYKTPGTGLGLTITKAIVSAMEGRIQVANQVPHGCIMTVVLPRQTPKKST